MHVLIFLLRHLLVTTATPAFKGCFCLKLVPVEACDVDCPGSWESSGWAGKGGGRGHTCRPAQVKEGTYDTSREKKEGLKSGSSLLQDRTGPVSSSLLSYGHYPKGTEWDSQNWVEEFARYQFREEPPLPPTPMGTRVLRFWEDVKEKKRRRRQKEERRVTKEEEWKGKEGRRLRRYMTPDRPDSPHPAPPTCEVPLPSCEASSMAPPLSCMAPLTSCVAPPSSWGAPPPSCMTPPPPCGASPPSCGAPPPVCLTPLPSSVASPPSSVASQSSSVVPPSPCRAPRMAPLSLCVAPQFPSGLPPSGGTPTHSSMALLHSGSPPASVAPPPSFPPSPPSCEDGTVPPLPHGPATSPSAVPLPPVKRVSLVMASNTMEVNGLI